MSNYANVDELMDVSIRNGHHDKEHTNKHFIAGIQTVLEYIGYMKPAHILDGVQCEDDVGTRWAKQGIVKNRDWLEKADPEDGEVSHGSDS